MPEKYKWQFYTSSEEAWDAMLSAIRGAKETIELEQFILSLDETGARFIDALRERARSGVKIRMLCDDVGSFSLSRSGIPAALMRDGAAIKFFNSVVPWSPNNEALWYFRDHKKLLIIDAKIGFTGGMCLGDAMKGWRESSVLIEGAVVAEMRESFEMMWTRSYHNLEYYFKSKAGGGSDFRYLSNSPLPDKHHMYRELVRAIRVAKHYVYLTTPYFLPDSRLMRSLKQAVRRGVEARLLVPHTTNYKILDIGMGTFFRDALEHRIRIFRFDRGQFIHSKTAVVDGKWATIGSLNLDNLSLRYNFEGNIVSSDRAFTFELEKQFLDDLKLSQELTLPEWERRSMMRKFLEILVWPIRKLL